MARRRREERARAAEHVVGFAERCLDGVQRDGAYDENGHGVVGETWISAGCADGEASRHMRSGAVMPSSASPLRSTSCDARASTRRARMIGSGSLSTCAL